MFRGELKEYKCNGWKKMDKKMKIGSSSINLEVMLINKLIASRSTTLPN